LVAVYIFKTLSKFHHRFMFIYCDAYHDSSNEQHGPHP